MATFILRAAVIRIVLSICKQVIAKCSVTRKLVRENFGPQDQSFHGKLVLP